MTHVFNLLLIAVGMQLIALGAGCAVWHAPHPVLYMLGLVMMRVVATGGRS